MTNHIEETAGIWGDYLLEHVSHVLKHVLQAMFPTGYHFIWIVIIAFYLFIYCFWDKLATWLWLAWPSPFSCLSLPSAGISVVSHPSGLQCLSSDPTLLSGYSSWCLRWLVLFLLFVLKCVLFVVHVCNAGHQSQDLGHTGHVLYHWATIPAWSPTRSERPDLKGIFAHEPLVWTLLSLLGLSPHYQSHPRAHNRHTVSWSEEAKEKQLCPSLFM